MPQPRAGPSSCRGLPIWVMAEVPSVAYWIPTYAEMGIEGSRSAATI